MQKEQTSELPDKCAQIITPIRSRLTGVALAAGLLSIIAGIAISWYFLVSLEPKQKELLAGYTQATQAAQAANAPMAGDHPQTVIFSPRRDELHMTMTHDMGVVTMLTAVSVALVGISTLVTIVLATATRRETLRQIAQISNQLKALENRIR